MGLRSARTGSHVLAVRLDSAGDVLLSGPAVRALAHTAGRLSMLVGSRGRAAASILPGVDEVLVFDAPWILARPPEVSAEAIAALGSTIERLSIDRAVIFTSFHQSALPLALLLRMAGVRAIAAISDDYAGSLLDLRFRAGSGMHEAERMLSLACAFGGALPAGDHGLLRVVHSGPPAFLPSSYVVLHPGASVPARRWPRRRWRELAGLLARLGLPFVVTGGDDERELTSDIAGRGGIDLGSRTSWRELAGILAGAQSVVVGNTGPAHLAAAVGTPVVSLFAPTVPAERWRPYGVPHVLLGDQSAGCRGSRATSCPVPGHPCLDTVTSDDVMSAIMRLRERRAA